MKFILIFLFLPLSLLSQKIDGVNFVSPKNEIIKNPYQTLERISADYICLTPYALMQKDSTSITTEYDWMYWGDRVENRIKLVEWARENNKKIMLKPHFWVETVGWAGELKFSEEQWKIWEENYKKFILDHALFCEKYQLEYFCFGVELKTATQQRSQYFEQLIDSIRKIYSGKLLYAANWDNFENVSFWDKLDYIGIDAYFPLSDSVSPSKKDLKEAWKMPRCELKKLSEQYNKQIILTEFGYRNSDYAMGKQWLIDEMTSAKIINNKNQTLGYTVFFKELWREDFIAGGFLWKWWAEDAFQTGLKNDYSPQHKPVESVIKKWYTE